MSSFACAELGCASLDTDVLENCTKRACPFAWQRAREEDLLEREAKDARQARRILTVEDVGGVKR